MSLLDFGLGAESDLESEEVSEEEPLWLAVTSLDERVCLDCGPLEGEVFPDSVIDESFPDAEEISDGVLQLNVHAPRDWNCRCYAYLEQPTEEYPIWGELT